MIVNLDKLRSNGYSDLTIKHAFDNKIQELILLPTEKCNFRCTYCYEDFELPQMPRWLIDSIKLFISNRVKNIKLLNLSWFGGEPLLAKKVIYKITEHAFAECEKNQTNFTGGFTTNGYLLDLDTVSRLSKLNHASFQITLDGFADKHDTTRKLANGRGTFDRVWGNLLALRDSDIKFKISLRLHITHDNYQSMKQLVKMINNCFGNDNRFNIHFHNIANLGGPNSSDIKVLNKNKYQEILKEFTQLLRLDSNSEKSLHEDRHICYAAKPNSLLVRANGDLGKCTVAFDNPANAIGKFNKDGTVDVNNDVLRHWMHGFQTADPDILTCPATGIGTPKNNELKLNVV
jgi:uncharacterized protein